MNQYANWEQIETILIGTGDVRRYKIPDNDCLTLITHKNASSFGVEIRAEIPDDLICKISGLQNIFLDTTANEVDYYEILTRDKSLYSEFYTFVIDIAIIMKRDNTACALAIAKAFSNLAGLIESQPALSDRTIIGLIGELWFLDMLIEHKIKSPVSGWIGPLREPHDFRYGNKEFEVKSTLSSYRRHMINGLKQPYPSVNCELRFISIQFMRASGTDLITLPKIISKINNNLEANSLSDFNLKLQTYGYRKDHETLYSKLGLKLRTLPISIYVDDDFPRIPENIAGSSDSLAGRLIDLVYTIDFESLGKKIDEDVLSDMIKFK